MSNKVLVCLLTMLCLISRHCIGQSEGANSVSNGQIIQAPPVNLFSEIRSRCLSVEKQLVSQSEKQLRELSRKEAYMSQGLNSVDPCAATQLPKGGDTIFTKMISNLKNSTANGKPLSGEYKPYIDSLNGILKYFQQTPLSAVQKLQLDQATAQFESLRGKLTEAENIRKIVLQRQQQIKDYIREHAAIAQKFGKQFQGMQQELYYYTEQAREYKQMLNNPDKLEKEALTILNQTSSFQNFMQQHSQLAGFFTVAPNYNDATNLAGFQTREQVSALINAHLTSSSPDGLAALQSKIQSAQDQLSVSKDRIEKLGSSGADLDMPDFKPNNQRTKTFWKRLEYGANFQTTKYNNYFPITSDLGLTVGYKINGSTSAGMGASYKIGWGKDFQHISFSSQGVGLRSYFDTRLKGSFYLSGGFEYNYLTAFQSLQQLPSFDNWTKSGLIGLSKIVSLKSRTLKKAKVQLLWDFLSYQQMPRTQPVIFRFGYGLN